MVPRNSAASCARRSSSGLPRRIGLSSIDGSGVSSRSCGSTESGPSACPVEAPGEETPPCDRTINGWSLFDSPAGSSELPSVSAGFSVSGCVGPWAGPWAAPSCRRLCWALDRAPYRRMNNDASAQWLGVLEDRRLAGAGVERNPLLFVCHQDPL